MSLMPSCGTPAVKFRTKATSSFDWSTSKEVLAKIAGHSLDFSSWPGSSRAELFPAAALLDPHQGGDPVWDATQLA